MVVIGSVEAEREAVLNAARLMITAARTAPKARGDDAIITAILTEEDKARLADKMENIGRERDSRDVRDADAVVLIGVKCGEPSEALWLFKLKLIDLGIALGSAVKIASILNVDNRIMYSVGLAAKEMGIIEGDEIVGVPLSIKGKNIFFDRRQ